MLRPTPGDPWGVEQHHWNTGAKENQQLKPGGPSNRQKPVLLFTFVKLGSAQRCRRMIQGQKYGIVVGKGWVLIINSHQ